MANIEQKVAFDQLSPESRVWVFQAERELSETEQRTILDHLNKYLSQWNSHGRALSAMGQILESRFVMIAQDHTAGYGASGCSIDSMTQQILHLQQALGVQLIDRQTVYYVSENTIKSLPLAQLKSAHHEGVITSQTKVYNTLIKKLADLEKNWLLSIEDSWHKRFV